MIWYLLSPFRGTSQPPRLSAGHPVRRAFYRHGKIIAQHWLVTMLLSVAVAMGFSYPTIIDNPTAGLAASPHHVWTLAKHLDEVQVPVDIEMHQIWVHGSYMNAIDKDVLKQALAVQQRMAHSPRDEDARNAINPVSDSAAANLSTSDPQFSLVHSPLAFWNNSAEIIDRDDDLLKTINTQKYSSSSLNVQLRPASVFGGKKFARQRLIAADALVITLLSRDGTGRRAEWQDNVLNSLTDICDGCALFPTTGHSSVFEFSFTPLSPKEHAALTLAYSAMAVYVILSFRKMRAFHSRFGLVVTAITQMTCSILASFTICAVLKINLSMIPKNAYPFVVLVLGVENMFRLINAVLAYPSTMATELRIANALGDIGPLSIAAAAQNLSILFLLSTVVSPGVAAFCAFAAIASLFDAFFLLSFFVAVLNVDIRRLELMDALARGHQHNRHRRQHSPAHNTWFDALVQGRLPFSTRMAGTAVTTTFILFLNYHFSEHTGTPASLRTLLGLEDARPPLANDLDMFAFPAMNATLTPAEWMHMQDFDTAKAVMRLAKPGADSFVARLYAPLVVVLGNSDRTHNEEGTTEWVRSLRAFAVHHFYPTAVAVVFTVGLVAILMNFLLYNEAGDEDNDIALEELEDALALSPVSLSHKLDIVRIASNENGQCVTVALDRTIAITTFDRVRRIASTKAMSTAALQNVAWPIQSLAIDQDGDWVACHCVDNRITASNITTDTTIPNMVQYPDHHPPVVFAFVSLLVTGSYKLYFVVVTAGGRLSMTCVADRTCYGIDISHDLLVGACFLESTGLGRQLLTVTERGECNTYSWSNDAWNHTSRQEITCLMTNGIIRSTVHVQQQSGMNIIVVSTTHTAVFLSANNLAILAAFDLQGAESQIQKVLIGSWRKCAACDGVAVKKISAVGSSRQGTTTILTTWSAGNGIDAALCLVPQSESCTPCSKAISERHALDDAGASILTTSHGILGLRKSRKDNEGRNSTNKTAPVVSHLRERRRKRHEMQTTDQHWEAYRLSVDGEFETADAVIEEHDALYVSHPGPVVALDSQSVAIAFGNAIQIVHTKRVAGATSPSRRSS